MAPTTSLVLPVAAVIDVEGCHDCPFFRSADHFGSDHCELAPGRSIPWEERRAGGAPAWCPLRTIPAVVRRAPGA